MDTFDASLSTAGIDTKQKVPSDGVYKYEERENAWLRFAKMPQPRNHHATVYCKGALYVLGELTDEANFLCVPELCLILKRSKINFGGDYYLTIVLETNSWFQIAFTRIF